MAKIDPSEIERRTGRKFENLEALRKHLAGQESNESGPQVLSSLGVDYQIGNHRVPALTLGMFTILDLLNSPFVDTSEDREFKRIDMIFVLYVACNGIDAARPLMGIRQRMAAVEKYREDAKTSPEMLAVFLDRIDRIAMGHAEFDRAAISWFDEIRLSDWREIEEVVEMMFSDLYRLMSGLLQDDDGKKKNNDMMPNG